MITVYCQTWTIVKISISVHKSCMRFESEDIHKTATALEIVSAKNIMINISYTHRRCIVDIDTSQNLAISGKVKSRSKQFFNLTRLTSSFGLPDRSHVSVRYNTRSNNIRIWNMKYEESTQTKNIYSLSLDLPCVRVNMLASKALLPSLRLSYLTIIN